MWKKYPGFDYLEVSDEGKVRRIEGRVKIGVTRRTLVLKPRVNKDGYYNIKWSINKKIYNRLAHRMVLETFRGHCPPEKISRHLDSNKLNNNLSNLQWGTQFENYLDRVNNGTNGVGKLKLNKEKVRKIRSLRLEGISQKRVGAMFNVGRSTIADIDKGKTWKWLT